MNHDESRVAEALEILNGELVEVEGLCMALKVTPQCVSRWVKQKRFPDGTVFESGSFRRFDLKKILTIWSNNYNKRRP